MLLSIILLLVFMGVFALQKSMNLKTEFESTPDIVCKIMADDSIAIFDNFENAEFAQGLTINENTLSFDASKNDSIDSNFVLQFENGMSEDALLIEITGSNVSTVDVSDVENFSEVVLPMQKGDFLTLNSSSIVQIEMSKVVPIDMTLEGVKVDMTYSENTLIETSAKDYCLPIGEDFVAKFVTEDRYINPNYALSIGGNQQTIENGVVNISVENLTGNLVFTGSAEFNAYTIIFDKNSETATGEMEKVVVDYDTDFTLPSNGFTNGDLKFKGWNTESDGNGVNYYDEEIINNTTNKGYTIILYAQWGVDAYEFVFNITYTNEISLVFSRNQYLFVLATKDEGFTLAYGSHAGNQHVGWLSTNINDGQFYPLGSSYITYNGVQYNEQKSPTDFDTENYFISNLSLEEYKSSGSNLVQNLTFNFQPGWKVFIFSNCGYAGVDKQMYLQEITEQSASIGVVTSIMASGKIGGIEFVMPSENASMDLTFYAIDTD